MPNRRTPLYSRPSYARYVWPLISAGLCIIVVVALISSRAGGINPKIEASPSPTPYVAPFSVQPVAGATAIPHPTSMDASVYTAADKCVIPIAKLYGMDLYVSSDFRSYEEQQALFDQGRIVNGHIVTSARGGQSLHNFGLAVDFADHASGNSLDYGILSAIGAWCGLEHNDRGYEDPPHFQYRTDLSLAQLQAGFRPKPLTLPCEQLTSNPVTKALLTVCEAPNFQSSAEGITSGEYN